MATCAEHQPLPTPHPTTTTASCKSSPPSSTIHRKRQPTAPPNTKFTYKVISNNPSHTRTSKPPRAQNTSRFRHPIPQQLQQAANHLHPPAQSIPNSNPPRRSSHLLPIKLSATIRHTLAHPNGHVRRTPAVADTPSHNNYSKLQIISTLQHNPSQTATDCSTQHEIYL